MNPSTRVGGTWRIAGEERLFAAVRGDLERAASRSLREQGRCELDGVPAFFKRSALRGKHALRHAVRSALGLSDIPRLQEFANLAWLREHGFLAPRPLLAGARLRHGVPGYQFLYSEFLDAPTLGEHVSRGSPDARRSALEALAVDLARLHALGFVHGDLFPRNLLVCGRDGGVRIAFLDCWSTRPGRGWRGPAHDLGCLLLDGAGLFDRDEQQLLVTTYARERSRSGMPVSSDWAEGVTRARLDVYRREARRRPGLVEHWECPRPP